MPSEWNKRRSLPPDDKVNTPLRTVFHESADLLTIDRWGKRLIFSGADLRRTKLVGLGFCPSSSSNRLGDTDRRWGRY